VNVDPPIVNAANLKSPGHLPAPYRAQLYVCAALYSRRQLLASANDQTLLVAPGQNESAPETGALPKFVRASGSDLGRLDLQTFTGACDRDRPRLHRLRNLAHEVDV
jgi:hypothetical protein